MRKWSKALIGSIALAVVPLAATPAAAQYLQCAPYAREVSGIQLFGNADGWWAQASGRYDRGHAPQPGAVLVFKATGAMHVGHVATVSRIVSDREIRVTHANWSVIGGHRGQIERGRHRRRQLGRRRLERGQGLVRADRQGRHPQLSGLRLRLWRPRPGRAVAGRDGRRRPDPTRPARRRRHPHPPALIRPTDGGRQRIPARPALRRSRPIPPPS